MQLKTITTWLCGAILAAATAAPVLAQVGIYIGRTPPPIRYEVRPPIPAEGYVWIDGYWAINGPRYVWVPGRWERPPYPGAYWVHPHYDHYDRGWQIHEGYWDREDHGGRHEFRR